MPSAARSRNEQLARQPTETPDQVADELRRYNDHLRDMRGLTAHAWLIDFLTNSLIM